MLQKNTQVRTSRIKSTKNKTKKLKYKQKKPKLESNAMHDMRC
ncbi:hypothetical protein GCM10010301_73520 [Streptomyces plicatus]|nr:hypothetical protein GCM10010301_73520 [Streptomyces plicatus]